MHGSLLAVETQTGRTPVVILAVNFFGLVGKLESAILGGLRRSLLMGKKYINKIDTSRRIA